MVVIIVISWYNNSVKKRRRTKKGIKKDDRLVFSLYDHLFKKRIYKYSKWR
nr:MAG TPA: hypothetical protein [Caudoviricetes sp.]